MNFVGVEKGFLQALRKIHPILIIMINSLIINYPRHGLLVTELESPIYRIARWNKEAGTHLNHKQKEPFDQRIIIMCFRCKL